jgi:predicted SAM-dependent methyltransferase
MRYHLGCGAQRLEGYTNIDLQETAATDLVMDLTLPSLPTTEPVDTVFSHAFFEHLRRDQRVPHLKVLKRALVEDGFVCYMGLPDFRRVAELYLARGPGVIGPVFDLFNVYRYTHGDPEMSSAEGWEAQLHKSLFDVPEVARLLRDAGYPSYVVFRYVFPGEPAAADLALGFYAVARRIPQVDLQRAAREFLSEFDGRFLQAATIRFDDGLSRNPTVARLLSVPQRRLVQRMAYGVASILARNTHPA